MCQRNILFGLFSFTALIGANAPMLQTVAQYQEAFNSSKPTVIMYTGSHCGPCRATKPHFHAVASQNSDMQYYMIETNDSTFDKIMNTFNISSIPTFIFSFGGKVLHRTTGGQTRSQLEGHVRTFRSKLPAEKAKQEPSKKIAQTPQKNSSIQKPRTTNKTASTR